MMRQPTRSHARHVLGLPALQSLLATGVVGGFASLPYWAGSRRLREELMTQT